MPISKRMSAGRTLAIALGMALGGVAFGIALAVFVDPLIRDACGSDGACRGSLRLLFGGIALVQALNLLLMTLLVDWLNRRSEGRLLQLIRRPGA